MSPVPMLRLPARRPVLRYSVPPLNVVGEVSEPAR